MCDICQQTPCAHGCPNEPKRQCWTYCDSCGAAIRMGDEYIHHEKSGDDFCMNCATVKTAEAEDE